MTFKNDSVYCIHNTGNNFETIFFSNRNKEYFKEKIYKYIEPFAEVLHISLLENQFSILIKTKDEMDLTLLTKNIGVMLSGYTRGVNNEQGRIGSLFRRGTKAYSSISEFPKYLKDKMEAFRHFFEPSSIVNFPLTVKKFYSAVELSIQKKDKEKDNLKNSKEFKKYTFLKLDEILIHPVIRYKSIPEKEKNGQPQIAPG